MAVQTIDLTPMSQTFNYMVGDTWNMNIQVKNPDNSIQNLAGAKIFADILQQNTEVLPQLRVGAGIELAQDNLSFFVKKDWRGLETINGVETLTPKLSELPVGRFKVLVTIQNAGVESTIASITVNVLQEELAK